MSKNLFIASTPFHLLTCFILSNSMYAKDENYLALVHPQGYDKWQENPVMKFMSSEAAGYAQVYPWPTLFTSKAKESFRAQNKLLLEKMGGHDFSNVFAGVDNDPQIQMLIAALGHTEFYRYEDGLYSYYNADRNRSVHHMLFHKLKIKIMCLLAGIPLGMYINTINQGSSKAGKADYMYMPQLLARYSPKTVEITKAMIDQAMDKLIKAGLMEQKYLEGEYIYFLSQPVTNQGKISFEDEIAIIAKLVQELQPNEKMVYKPHPNDSAHKLAYLQEHFPQLIYDASKEPIEVLLYREPLVKRVISYQTTTLILAKKFTGRNIECVSLVNYYHQPLNNGYVKLMQDAGVIFPKKE